MIRKVIKEMKQINVYFDDDDFIRLNEFRIKQSKKKLSWRDFILLMFENNKDFNKEKSKEMK